MTDLRMGGEAGTGRRLRPGLVLFLMARSTRHSGQQYTESSLGALGKQVEWVSVSTAQQHSLQVRALGTAIRHVTSKTGSGGG